MSGAEPLQSSILQRVLPLAPNRVLAKHAFALPLLRKGPNYHAVISLRLMKSNSVGKLHMLDLMRLLVFLATVCCDW